MAENDKGTWIKLYRDIQYNWLWQLKPFSKAQAWIDLIIMAHHSDGIFSPCEDEVIDGKRGYVYRSIKSLADRWGWDRKTVSKFLSRLETENMIKVFKKQGSDRTSIAIVNYDKFQKEGTRRRTSKGQEHGQVKDKSLPIDKNGIRTEKNVQKNGEETASPISSNEDPAAAPAEDDESDVVDFGAMTDEEYESWVKKWHESRNI